ncbi:cytochrome D1 domain-containing protein [Alkalimarinus sediminis]|uniref:cytochrome D1 domain-containing protein n=1 Tax=Alkalimarinus sediminis TaxID=1632866 RepID=UPI0023AFDA72|nr:cytochrome D1 domain-containing protein [Alkalimarinus sediminis]
MRTQKMLNMKAVILTTTLSLSAILSGCASTQATNTPVQYKASGDLGTIIERADGAVSIVNTTTRTVEGRIEGLGDLSHASIVYSRDEQFAYVFGRDGGLTKVDILNQNIDKRVLQAGNSIGGAISQDGKLVAVSNYTPGGVKVFDAETLELVIDIPAIYTDENGEQKQSKTVGLVDAPGQRFVFSLFEGNETWIADFSEAATSSVSSPKITKLKNIGKQPYDALISPDGRYYIAGLFGQDGLALVDLWHPEKGSKHILPNYGKGEQRLPVYKMPHLEGWAVAGNYAFVPAVGRHEVLVIDMNDWTQVGTIPVYGQPVFVMSRPDAREIWVNFSFPKNDTLQMIDAESFELKKTLKPGKAVLHMEFTPRGEEVWVSVRDEDTVKVYNTATYEEITSLKALKPSGIFFTSRAHRIGL